MYKPTPSFLITLVTLAIIAACTASVARADDKVSWKLPTQYTDGSALDSADIDGIVIRYFEGKDEATAKAGNVVGAVTSPGSALSIMVTRDATVANTRCYQAATLMKSGVQGSFAPAAMACKTITVAPPPVDTRKPKVITGLTVE